MARRIIALALLALVLASSVYADGLPADDIGSTMLDGAAASAGVDVDGDDIADMTVSESVEVVTEPLVSEDPVRTFLNLFSFLQRDLGEGGLVVLDDRTMELVTSTGTSHTPEWFFADGLPENLIFGYVPDVPPLAAMAFVSLVPDSRHAIQELRPYLDSGDHVFMYIGMRLDNVPDDFVLRPVEYDYFEVLVRRALSLRGLDDDMAIGALCAEYGLGGTDELVMMVIQDPAILDGLVDQAAMMLFPRTVNDASSFGKAGVVLLIVAGILAVTAIVASVILHLAGIRKGSRKSADETAEDAGNPDSDADISALEADNEAGEKEKDDNEE